MELQPKSKPLIRMSNIVKVFKTVAGEVTVLKGIDADFNQGEFVSIVGRSGSGKSTLVNMITGIDHPTSGTVQVGDVILNTMNESQMATCRGRNLGIVFQFFQLLPMLTLVENVMLPMDFCNLYAPSEREQRALALLERVGLGDMADKLPGATAGGQQQSAAVARALANDPPIIIADEPTGNLDTRTADTIMQIFEELVGQGKTMIMVTHDRQLAHRASRTLIISDGELVNEAISSAFPDLPHASLLQLSHLAHAIEITPGATPILSEAFPSKVYLISRGQMTLNDLQGKIQHFSSGELIDFNRPHGNEVWTASDAPVELLEFDRTGFLRIINSTAMTNPDKTSTGESAIFPIEDSLQ